MIFSRLHQIQSSTSTDKDSLKWLFPVLFSTKKENSRFPWTTIRGGMGGFNHVRG